MHYTGESCLSVCLSVHALWLLFKPGESDSGSLFLSVNVFLLTICLHCLLYSILYTPYSTLFPRIVRVHFPTARDPPYLYHHYSYFSSSSSTLTGLSAVFRRFAPIRLVFSICTASYNVCASRFFFSPPLLPLVSFCLSV